MNTMSRAGWLTVHEVLEDTRLPYRELMNLVERGELTTHTSGAAQLFDPDDVRRLADLRAAS